MKSSSGKNTLKPGINWLMLLLAVFVAAVMWYFVTVRDRIEGQVEVSINYTDIPPNLVVTSGLVNKITVRLKGPEALLRNLPSERLIQSVSLAQIKKGVTFVPLPSQDLSPSLRAFEVVDVQPPRLVVTADTVMERSVPVHLIPDSPLRGGALTVENLSVSPATVILRGPEDVISGISNVPLTITLDPKAAGTTVQKPLPLDTPSLVTATPASVMVRYTITSGREVLSRHCKIKVAHDATHHYTLEPKETNALVEVPEALAKSSSYLNGLEASVVPPPMDAGGSAKVKIKFTLPEGMTLLNSSVQEVTVKRIK